MRRDAPGRDTSARDGGGSPAYHGVNPSLHVEHKRSHVKQYFKENRALRTERTINNPGDFRVKKGLRTSPTSASSAIRSTASSSSSSASRELPPSHDPRTTPFVEKLDDVRRIYLDLPEPLNVAYAIGALAGLRTGEVFALRWPHVDLAARRIHVRESVSGPLKDKDSRMVPILDGLYPVLAQWKLRTGGEGRVIPPCARKACASASGSPASTSAPR